MPCFTMLANAPAGKHSSFKIQLKIYFFLEVFSEVFFLLSRIHHSSFFLPDCQCINVMAFISLLLSPLPIPPQKREKKTFFKKTVENNPPVSQLFALSHLPSPLQTWESPLYPALLLRSCGLLVWTSLCC